MNIQWYPGHMTKAKRMITEDLKLVDVIIELVDARLPISSSNPDIKAMANGKQRVIIMNKADLADPAQNEAFSSYFKSLGLYVITADSRNKNIVKTVNDTVMEACKEKIERNKSKGLKNRPIRAMIAGIPNVGKSTFINTYAGKASAKTGNRPGVTTGKQWIKPGKNLELLDTPGILWPKFDDEAVGIRLAIAGSVKDDILDMRELAFELVKILNKYYPDAISSRYEVEHNDDPFTVIKEVARSRGCLLKGGELDIDRASDLIIDDYRAGKLGRITLERFNE